MYIKKSDINFILIKGENVQEELSDNFKNDVEKI